MISIDFDPTKAVAEIPTLPSLSANPPINCLKQKESSTSLIDLFLLANILVDSFRDTIFQAAQVHQSADPMNPIDCHIASKLSVPYSRKHTQELNSIGTCLN
jgi:hypothetical protein